MITVKDGTIHLFTFKEGMLSAIAHDLRLSLRRFRVEVDGDRVRSVLMLDSLKVEGAWRNGRVDPSALSAKDLEKIHATMSGTVLRLSQFPQAVFDGKLSPATDGTIRISGDLLLVGRKAPVSFELQNNGTTVRATVDLQPTNWGIPPYSALAGTLRLRDLVRIEAEIPWTM